MGRTGKVVRDKRMLHLIGKYLRRGAIVDGPLSPLLANIYLDALDKELDRRKDSYCRYADDCNIYLGSQAAAERTLVNAAKSGTGRVRERKFPGVSTGSQEPPTHTKVLLVEMARPKRTGAEPAPVGA
jgi:RNA-directed DNA polymerase